MTVVLPVLAIPTEARSWIKNAVGGSSDALKRLHSSGLIYKKDADKLGHDLKKWEFQFIAAKDFTAIHVFWRTPGDVVFESCMEIDETARGKFESD